MRKILYLLAIISFFAAAPQAYAAESAAVRLQNRYKNVESMRASFTQILVHKESGARESRTGEMTFRKPFLLRWDVKQPAPELLLVTAKEIWNAFPDEEIVYKYPLSMIEDPSGILQVITGQARLDKDFSIEDEKADGSLTLLHAFPNEPSQSLTEVKLWVDPKTNLLHRAVVTDFFGNENDITFSDIKLDVKSAASTFSYTPPKGMKVEDRTSDDGGGQEKLLQ